MNQSLTIPALQVRQPIGDFFVGVMQASDLLEIAFADIRKIERDLDDYLGIQRKISPSRVRELAEYVNTKDATFPTSIILAVDEECADWDARRGQLTLSATAEIDYANIAKVLDGQHRLEGLKNLQDPDFFLNVTVFVGADLADQANIFATVNLAQTKVNRSLVYDLFDYAESRSPQKTAHDVTVALDRTKSGPFTHRIKRLGTRTEGRRGETLTQATVVSSLLDLITSNAMADRDVLLRGKRLKGASEKELERFPLRNLFIEGQDVQIAKILNNYFAAVQQRWPEAWEDRSKGNILPRTNGFRALMRAFKPLYLKLARNASEVVPVARFSTAFSAVRLRDEDFNTEKYSPGSSGETALYNDLVRFLELHATRG